MGSSLVLSRVPSCSHQDSRAQDLTTAIESARITKTLGSIKYSSLQDEILYTAVSIAARLQCMLPLEQAERVSAAAAPSMQACRRVTELIVPSKVSGRADASIAYTCDEL